MYGVNILLTFVDLRLNNRASPSPTTVVFIGHTSEKGNT